MGDAADPKSALLRCMAIFADAAEIDHDRARRWAQVRALTAAFWGREHGDPHWLIQANDQVAEQLV
jgi:streptomycin 6-kinase